MESAYTIHDYLDDIRDFESEGDWGDDDFDPADFDEEEWERSEARQVHGSGS